MQKKLTRGGMKKPWETWVHVCDREDPRALGVVLEYGAVQVRAYNRPLGSGKAQIGLLFVSGGGLSLRSKMAQVLSEALSWPSEDRMRLLDQQCPGHGLSQDGVEVYLVRQAVDFSDGEVRRRDVDGAEPFLFDEEVDMFVIEFPWVLREVAKVIASDVVYDDQVFVKGALEAKRQYERIQYDKGVARQFLKSGIDSTADLSALNAWQYVWGIFFGPVRKMWRFSRFTLVERSFGLSRRGFCFEFDGCDDRDRFLQGLVGMNPLFRQVVTKRNREKISIGQSVFLLRMSEFESNRISVCITIIPGISLLSQQRRDFTDFLRWATGLRSARDLHVGVGDEA